MSRHRAPRTRPAPEWSVARLVLAAAIGGACVGMSIGHPWVPSADASTPNPRVAVVCPSMTAPLPAYLDCEGK